MINREAIALKHSRILAPLTQTGWLFWITVIPLFLIFVWSFFAFAWQYHWGLGETGMGHPMSWTLYLVNFVFFIGISHAGTLISAILRITNAGWRTPITRAAEVVTVFALAAGPTNILFDLGRSSRFTWVATHAQFKSPLLWDFTCIMAYFTTCVLFLYVLMIPDIGLLRDRFPGRRWLYGPLSLGWEGTETQWKILKKASAILCIAVIPVAVSVHTVVSWVFGMQTQPMWHSTIFGPYFVVGAIYSGIAAIILVAAIIRRVYRLEQYLKPIHFNNLGLLLLVMTLLWFYFTFAEYLTTLYGGGKEEMAVFWVKVVGKYSPLFWLMVLCCFIIPFPILALKRTRTVLGTSIASVFILIGMWLERYLIIIPSLSEPRLFYERGSYMPSWVEWSMMAGLCAGFTLAIILFSKFFPVISIWEVEKEENDK
ncbi:MAG: polysulfide reductase [Deltaproteobacteria bacterium]|nr:polysulfide reductase [Deltaproteobacteria bacterium]